jgi:hypothetical protein
MRKYCKSGSKHLKHNTNYLVVITSPTPTPTPTSTPTPTPVYFMGRIDSREISWEYEENSTPTPTPTLDS